MGLQFYIGGSGAGKSFRLYQDVIRWSMEFPDRNYLILVPDQFTMQTQKDIVSMHPSHGIRNIEVLSFGRLSYRIFEEVSGNELPVLDDTGKSLILRKVAQDMEDGLTVLGKNLRKTGYIHEVKSALSEFMQYSVGEKELDTLIAFAGNRNALKYKLQDLKLLYQGFQSYIREKFITTEESLTLLRKVLHKSALIKNSVVVFDEFTGFTPIQNELIQEIMALAQEVIITSVIDAKENPYQQVGEQKLFYLTKKTLADLSKLGEGVGTKRKEDVLFTEYPVKRYEKNETLAYLEQKLFRYEARVKEPPFRPNREAIGIYEGANPREEVQFVCKKIHALIREKDYKYGDFAVVTGDLPGYAAVLETEFERYGIPVFLDQTKGIILNPFIEYIRSGFQVVLLHFTYEGVFHFLRSGLLDIPMEEVDRMENYVLTLGIKGRKRWSTPWLTPTKEMGQEWESALSELNENRQKVMDLLSPLLSLTRKATVETMVLSVYDFFLKGNLEPKIQSIKRHFEREGNLSKVREYAQIYRMVCDLLNQMLELLGTETMELSEFMKILDAGFEEMQVGIIPQSADEVVAGDIERTRLKKIKVLFFIGINDGIIPKSSGTGGILSDIDREFLTGSEIPLAAAPRQQMYTQRLYLYMNMTKPVEQLILTFSDVNGEGKSIRKAYLIGEIQRIFPTLPMERMERTKGASELYTPREGLLTLGASLRKYAAQTDNDVRLAPLFSWYQESPVYREWTRRLLETAFFEYQNHPVSQAVATALYGKTLENSVSRLESYASCAYAHFLKYGLTLREREEYSFENVDMGNVFHGVLELFSEKIQNSAYSWFDFPEELGQKLVSEALAQYAMNYKNRVLLSSERNLYQMERIRRILNRTVKTLQYQLKKGLFQPDKFELSFSVLEDLESVNITLSSEEKMHLRGRIDRVDTYEDEEHVYVKVIDYKSGNKSFDLVALYHGLQLQLVVYLNAAMELARKNHPEKEVIPAAVLYYQVTDPLVKRNGEKATPEEINQQLIQELCTKGIVNSEYQVPDILDTSKNRKSDVIPVAYKTDGSFTAASSVVGMTELSVISSYVNSKIKEIGTNILSGEIAVNPYERGTEDSCTYCPYEGICGYDEKLPGFHHTRILEEKKDEVLEKMEQKLSDEEGGEK